MEEFELYQLPNGIRILHKQVTHTKIAHCGFVLDIGSRDEKEHQQGIAHFWEHMAFKGTKKRKSFHILNRLEVVGGELNAYTTKEKICFYASILDTHYEKALELLKDITFDSTFPEREIEKERSVILEEMSMYYDAPDEAIQDDFEQLIFNNHPLGYNILGTPESVKSFKKTHFEKFIFENIDTTKLVFSSIGNIPFSKIKKMCEKYFSDIPTFRSDNKRITFNGYIPKKEIVSRSVSQAHCVLGSTAYELKHENRLKFFMLINILGGPGMNSRLNLALREKFGFVYNIEASYTPFIDTGMMSVYFGTEKKQLERSINLILKEFKKLREIPLGTLQLHTSKVQLMGQLAMAEESNINFMQMMAKSILDLGYIDSLEDIFFKIEKITAIELQEVAQEMFVEDQLSFLSYISD